MHFALPGGQQTMLGHITSAKVCKDKALLICVIIIIIKEANLSR